jgi:glycosyltransferase involved in cell wall biosynthesis
MPSEKIKVAIPKIGVSSWTGGLTYQSNLLYALNNFAPNIEIMPVGSDDGNMMTGASWKPLARPTLVLVHRLLPQKIADISYRYYKKLTGSIELSKNTIDAVFSLGYYNESSDIATLSWIPDFQHVHLPEMFSEEELYTRNNGLKHVANKSTLVVLSSNNALQDFIRFEPENSHKGRVMRFVAHVPVGIYDGDPFNVCKKYEIPERFIYLPNQFWKHKNHLLVLDALYQLKRINKRLFVVCTGNMNDNRNPRYFKHLLEKISSLGLKDQVAILGLIPHEDVYKLIRQSLFILNPSLFEGWSSTVEETKSVGKKILLSDIEVHREQDPPNAVFFNPRDTEDLAVKLKEQWEISIPGPDKHMEDQAKDRLPHRMIEFANTFVSIVKEAMAIVSH